MNKQSKQRNYKGKGNVKSSGRGARKLSNTQAQESRSREILAGREYHNKYDEPGSNGNHPSWYKANEQLAKDTASIPFGYQLGGRVDFGPEGDEFNNHAVPGVMRINFTPVYGRLDNIQAPLNIASRNIYTFLKSVNSRAKTYDAPDLALYLIAMDNVISFHEWMKRLYGLMNTASISNRYVAEAMVRAAGADYNSLLVNMNDFRAFINRYALRVSTLPIPSEFSIFARHAWLNSHVWYDSDTKTKAQSYIFVPNGFWRYGLDSDGAGQVEFKPLHLVSQHADGKAQLNFNQIQLYGEALISSVLYGAGDEDFNIIGGDILYAYGKDRIFRATTISEEYAVVPTYDEWVCDQINNLRAFGPLDTTSNFIKQDKDKRYLTHTCSVTLPKTVSQTNSAGHQLNMIDFEYPWNNLTMDQYINIMSDDTSPDHMLVATRFLQIPVPVTTATDRILEFQNVSSEIATNFCVYYYASETGKAKDWKLYDSGLYKTNNVIPYFGVTQGNEPSDMHTLNIDNIYGFIDVQGQLASFDRRPLMYAVIANSTGVDSTTATWTANTYIHDPYIDLNNFAVISRSTLTQMNDNVMLAMFGIDEFGKQISL